MSHPGLTDDTRDLDADPEHIEQPISLPDPHGLVSLEASLTGPGASLGAGHGAGQQPLLLHAQAGGQVAAASKVGWRCVIS